MGHFSSLDTTLREAGQITPVLRAERRQHQPSPSQYASAACHLELRHEPDTRWDTVRRDGVRYVTITSGTSGRLYLVRADMAGCGCTWSQKCGSPCSHRLALYLADLEDDLRESASWDSFRSLYAGCAGGCGRVVESSGLFLCDDCSAARARTERMAAARARVMQEWVG